jgi:hypothetical protein
MLNDVSDTLADSGEVRSRDVRLRNISIGVVAGLLGLYLASVALEFAMVYFYVLFGGMLLAVALGNYELAFILAPLAITNPYAFTATGTNLLFSEYALLVVFIAFFIRMTRHKWDYYLPWQFFGPAILLVVTGIFSLGAAQYVRAGVLQIVRHLEILIVLFFVILNGCDTERMIKRMVFSLTIGGTIACIIGVVMFALVTEQTGELHRAIGKHGGSFGAVAASTLLLALGLFFYERNMVKRMTALLMAPCAATALILSQTRAWIAALALALLIIIFAQGMRGRAKILFYVLLAAGGITVIIQTNVFGLVKGNLLEGILLSAFRFGPRLGVYSTTDMSMVARMNAWRFAIEQFLASPILGIGIGNLRFSNYFIIELGEPGPNTGFVDSQYIQGFAEMGIIGGTAWIVYIINAVRAGARSIRTATGTALRGEAFGLYGGLLVFVLGSFFWVVTPTHESFALLVLHIGLLVNIRRLTDTTQRSTHEPA